MYLFLYSVCMSQRAVETNIMLKAIMCGIIALLSLIFATTAFAAADNRFDADLKGSEEVPSVITQMTGDSRFKYEEDEDMIDFRLRVRNGNDITMAHLHCAPKGQNGPVVVTLFGMIPGGFDVNGELADYSIHDANIVAGACPGITNVETLVQAIRDDKIYVNVHTVAHPSGEIRGQLGD